MPIVTISVLEGHTREQKDALHSSVARAVFDSLGVPLEYVNIQIVEMKPENNSVGGVTIDQMGKKKIQLDELSPAKQAEKRLASNS